MVLFPTSGILASNVLIFLELQFFFCVFANLMTGHSNLQPKIVDDEEETYSLHKIN